MNLAVYLADQNPHRDRTLGITNFTRCLLSGLAERPDVHLTTIESRSSYSFDGPRVSRYRLPWRTDHAFARVLTDNFGPALTGSIRPDVFYYPKGYISYLMRPRCPAVGTVHDTILQFYADHYPHYRSRPDLAYWIGLMKASLARFDMVLAVSQTTEQQIREFCDRYRIRTPQIRVTYEASDHERAEVGTGKKGDYVVHFASEAPHKKTRRLMELWMEHRRDARSWPELKLVGRRTPLVEEFLRCPQVSLASCPSDNELAQVLEGARALLLPSEIEGFGLPALEAYYHGTPVCFVQGTSLGEMLSPFTSKGGFFLDDGDSFKQALEDVLTMSSEEVLRVRDGLRIKYAKRKFIEAVTDSCKELSSKARA